MVCAHCWRRQTDIDGIRSLFAFDDVIRKAIHDMKYRSVRAISPCLARFLADSMAADPMPADVLVAVPLHPRRLRQRGYNQSGLLAGEVGRSTGLPVLDGCLIRVKQARPQVRAASIEERRRNVIGAFACRDDRAHGKQVILIDDVCTSGATLESCASALKNGGAASVWGLTLAREIYS